VQLQATGRTPLAMRPQDDAAAVIHVDEFKALQVAPTSLPKLVRDDAHIQLNICAAVCLNAAQGSL
jgi:hypothetical protein